MTNDIETRILQQFEVRLEDTPEVTPRTIRALLDDDRDSDFGDDDELLEAIVDYNER